MTQPMLIVDDEPLMCERLHGILVELGHAAESLFCAGSIAQAQALADKKIFALAVVDLGLSDGSGIDLIRWLRARDDASPILVISAWNTEELILAALREGATGYVLKEREDVEISLCLRSVLQGGAPIDPFIAKRILGMLGVVKSIATIAQESSRGHELAAMLSEREIGILKLVAKGMTDREIARVVQLSNRTVECHVSRIYRKLAVHSRTEAIFEARAHGVLL